jgi:hypothetical protein
MRSEYAGLTTSASPYSPFAGFKTRLFRFPRGVRERIEKPRIFWPYSPYSPYSRTPLSERYILPALTRSPNNIKNRYPLV